MICREQRSGNPPDAEFPHVSFRKLQRRVGSIAESGFLKFFCFVELRSPVMVSPQPSATVS